MARVMINGLWGFIDTTGKIVIPAKYKTVHGFAGGINEVAKDGDWGYIDNTGKEIPFPADCSLEFPHNVPYGYVKPDQEGRNFELLNIKRKGKWGYMNWSGQIAIDPQFDKPADFYNGIGAVCLNGKSGYINLQGNYILEPKYKETKKFNDNIGIVEGSS